MPRYVGYGPTWASVKMAFTSPKKISKKKLKERFMEEAEPVEYGLCHQCSRGVELDETNIDWNNWDGEITEEEDE